jgi:predicted lipoprotein with Yx(FWY)xxD motif
MKLRTLALFAFILLIAAACGTEGGEDTTTVATDPEVTTTTSDSGQEETTTTVASDDATTSTGVETMDGVHAADTDLGTILVDPDGFTLYIFTADGQGESTCYDGCAELWPPLSADVAISSDLDASIFGATTRTDGTEQLTVDGRPLYLYTPDTSPGDTTGQGFSGVWFVVDADGNVIEAATDDGTVLDYGY